MMSHRENHVKSFASSHEFSCEYEKTQADLAKLQRLRPLTTTLPRHPQTKGPKWP